MIPVCQICGNEIERKSYKGKIESKKIWIARKTCSKPCFKIWMSNIKIGVPRNVITNKSDKPDTTISEIVFDKDIEIIQNGYVLKRHYKTRLCRYCKEPIPLIMTSKGRIIHDNAHNVKEFCCREHFKKGRNNYTGTKKQKDGKTINTVTSEYRQQRTAVDMWLGR